MRNLFSYIGKGLLSNIFSFGKKAGKWAIRTEHDKDGMPTYTFINKRSDCSPWEKKIWDAANKDYGLPKGKK